MLFQCHEYIFCFHFEYKIHQKYLDFFVSKAVYTMSYATTQDDYSN